MTLLQIELFRDLSNMELSQVLGKLERRSEPAGAELFRQGDPGDCMYVLEQGKIQLYSEMPDGRRQPLVQLGEGATFGEMALLTGEPRSATAVAAADSVLYVMDREAFGRLIAEKSSISAYFIRLLSQRLVRTNDRLQSSKEARERRVLDDADRLPPELGRLVVFCSLLPAFDDGLLQELLGIGESMNDLLERHPELREFVALEEGAPGLYRLLPSAKPILAELQAGRHSAEETAAWIARAADHWLRRGDWALAAAVYADRHDWTAALDIAESRDTRTSRHADEGDGAEPRRNAAESVAVRTGLGKVGRDKANSERADTGEPNDGGSRPDAGRNGAEDGRTADAGRIDDAGCALLERCPAELLLPRQSLVVDYARLCAKRGRSEGLALVELALERRESLGYAPERTSELCELAAELCRAAGQPRKALDYLRQAETVAGSRRSPDARRDDSSEERTYKLAKQKLDQDRSREQAANAFSKLRAKRWSGPAAIAAALASLAYFHFADPLGGLSRHGMDFVGIGIAAVAMWMVSLVPDYLVALLMAMLWTLGGLVTPEVALSGFASTTWLYMLFILALGAAIAKSGILYRLSLHALKRFPPHYRGQLWGIVAGGIALNPLIPSSSAKVSLGVPIARTLAESMGFRDRSHGSAGLGLAATVFYGFTAPFVLTGSYTNVMAFGLVSGLKPPNWFQWFYYALPAFGVFAGLMLLQMKFMFKRTESARPVSREVVDDQLRILGAWTKDERWTVLAVAGCIALMIAQPLHGIDNAWVMLLGFAVLLVTGTLDTRTLKNGIDWTFLLFIGVAFSFAEAAKELGIVEALAGFLGAHMGGFIGSPMLFLAVVMLLSFAVTLVVRDDPAVVLLVIALLPLSERAGIDPWVLVFAILLATDPFFFAYQSPTYLTAYYSAEGKAFSHRQGRRIALAYAAAVIVAVVASVPYWRWLGLIR